ncbi:MAG TPA: flagellar biosynthesis anti-sigma factor FlgM [Chromatiales bacterium]|nr:flagellar biosynthesis anti-sigma factor FlgM [Chromatiales bacterium]
MTAEINALPGGIVQNSGENKQITTPQENRTSSGTGNAVSGSAQRDSVSLSASATRLQALEAQIAKLPVVDQSRVDNVRHDIAAGTFAIDPMTTADKLLDMERSLA